MKLRPTEMIFGSIGLLALILSGILLYVTANRPKPLRQSIESKYRGEEMLPIQSDSAVIRMGELNELAKQITRDQQEEAHRDYTAVIGLGIAGIVSLLGAKIAANQSRANDINTAQHDEIFRRHDEVLKRMDRFESILAKEAAIEKFHNIIRSFSSNENTPLQLRAFLDMEGGRLIAVAEEAMTEKLTMDVYREMESKINNHIYEAREQAMRVFGAAFAEAFKSVQRDSTDHLKASLKRIAETTDINHNYERFVAACNSFLLEHLTNIIVLFKLNHV